MGDRLPSWDELRTLMRASKPARSCWAYAIGRDPVRVEPGDDIDTMPGWLASALEPARFAGLATAEGAVLGREVVDARPAVLAEVRGLRGTAPARVWVDAATGTIVRMERVGDPAPLLVLDGLETVGDASA